MVICRREAHPELLEKYRGNSSHHPGVGHNEQSTENKRLQICRPNNLLRLYAGSRHGKRSYCRLLQIQIPPQKCIKDNWFTRWRQNRPGSLLIKARLYSKIKIRWKSLDLAATDFSIAGMVWESHLSKLCWQQSKVKMSNGNVDYAINLTRGGW